MVSVCQLRHLDTRSQQLRVMLGLWAAIRQNRIGLRNVVIRHVLYTPKRHQTLADVKNLHRGIGVHLSQCAHITINLVLAALDPCGLLACLLGSGGNLGLGTAILHNHFKLGGSVWKLCIKTGLVLRIILD